MTLWNLRNPWKYSETKHSKVNGKVIVKKSLRLLFSDCFQSAVHFGHRIFKFTMYILSASLKAIHSWDTVIHQLTSKRYLWAWLKVPIAPSPISSVSNTSVTRMFARCGMSPSSPTVMSVDRLWITVIRSENLFFSITSSAHSEIGEKACNKILAYFKFGNPIHYVCMVHRQQWW